MSAIVSRWMVGPLFGALLAALALAQEAPRAEPPIVAGEKVPAGAVAVVDGEVITLGTFLDQLWDRHAAQPAGVEALDDLVQRRVTEINMQRRGLVIEDVELQKHYADLDRQYREATGGKMSIASAIESEGITVENFMRRLRLQLAVQKMAEQDFKRSDITPADQQQWIRSKTLDAAVERDPAKLPANAVARVHDVFVTKEEFARTLVKALSRREMLDLVSTAQQAALSEKMTREAGIEITREDRDAQFRMLTDNFAADPKYEGIAFEDFLKQTSGLSLEAYLRSPGFLREVRLARLGRHWLKDEDAQRVYEEKKDLFGPKHDVRHIYFRAVENPKPDELTRSFAEATRQAELVLEQIRKGDSFDELVKVLSEDANSKFKGGSLGTFTPADLARFPDLEAAVKGLKVGEIGGPVRSNGGVHIVKVAGIEPAPPLSPEIVQDLRKAIAFERFREAWRAAARGVDLRVLYEG